MDLQKKHWTQAQGWRVVIGIALVSVFAVQCYQLAGNKTSTTVIKAATPRKIPKTDMNVITETNTCLRFALK